MVVADNSDISSGALTIEPPLKSAVSGSAITFDSVLFQWPKLAGTRQN